MNRLLLIAAMGLSITAAGVPASAQVLVDSATSERMAERGLVITAAAERITVLLGQTLGDPAIVQAFSPEGIVHAVETKAQRIADTRAELARISADLQALPPIANPEGLDLVRSFNQDTLNTAELARRGDGILEALQAIPGAVRARDQARFTEAVSRVASGSVLMQEAQGAMMRAQAALQQPDWPSHAQFLVMSCLSDAQAAMQAGISGLQPRADAAVRMEEAENCVRDQIVRGRANIAAADATNPLRIRLAPLDADLFDAMSEAQACVASARQGVLRNDGANAVAGAFNACYGPIGARVHDLIGRQHRILADMT